METATTRLVVVDQRDIPTSGQVRIDTEAGECIALLSPHPEGVEWAHKLAAAPELLDTLRAIKAAIDNDTISYPDTWWELKVRIRATIEKAEGC